MQHDYVLPIKKKKEAKKSSSSSSTEEEQQRKTTPRFTYTDGRARLPLMRGAVFFFFSFLLLLFSSYTMKTIVKAACETKQCVFGCVCVCVCVWFFLGGRT